MPISRSFFVCLLSFLFISCHLDALAPGQDVKGESGFTYSESKSKWLQMKKEEGNSYKYRVYEISWTGHGSNTILTIENDIVTSRTYQEFFMDPDTGDIENGNSYHEVGNDVGSNQAGARPWTIDDLYGICIAEYLVVDEGSNTVHFDTDEFGILSLCGFVPDDCADDCFEGIRLEDFEWL